MPMDEAAAKAQLKHLADKAAGLSGLDFLSEMVEGKATLPLGQHLGMHLVAVEAGRARFRLQPSPLLCNPAGVLHGGIYGLLLDSCMGCAVSTRCPKGTSYTTLEYKVNIVRGQNGDAGPIDGEGWVLHFGRRTATAEGKIFSATGQLIAHGTTTCLLLGDPATAKVV